jgi:HSP20 family molecular chaperone IbpA
VFLPPADIYETGDNIVVLAEMPGVAPDGMDITPRAAGIDDPRAKRR